MGPPVGLYSHAVAGGPGGTLLAVAGQLAVAPEGGEVAPTVEEQLRQVMASLAEILRQAGGSLEHVLNFRTYLIDPDDISRFYAERERLWQTYFPGGVYPANTLLVVQRLVRPEYRIEIEALALLPDAS
jgi:enamine deaminase RidA (YjgF/YER057c/UK114 family)